MAELCNKQIVQLLIWILSVWVSSNKQMVDLVSLMAFLSFQNRYLDLGTNDGVSSAQLSHKVTDCSFGSWHIRKSKVFMVCLLYYPNQFLWLSFHTHTKSSVFSLMFTFGWEKIYISKNPLISSYSVVQVPKEALSWLLL